LTNHLYALKPLSELLNWNPLPCPPSPLQSVALRWSVPCTAPLKVKFAPLSALEPIERRGRVAVDSRAGPVRIAGEAVDAWARTGMPTTASTLTAAKARAPVNRRSERREIGPSVVSPCAIGRCESVIFAPPAVGRTGARTSLHSNAPCARDHSAKAHALKTT